MKGFSIVLVLVMAFFVVNSLWANDAQNAAFANGKAIAAAVAYRATYALKHFDPKKLYPQYTSHPKQESYYGGVTGGSNLAPAARKAAASNKNARSIINEFLTGPHFNINTNSKILKHARLIENDSYDIANGITDQYVNCKHKYYGCKTTYINHTCSVGNHHTFQCTRNYVVHAKITPYTPCVHITSFSKGTTANKPTEAGYCQAGLVHLKVIDSAIPSAPARKTITIPVPKNSNVTLYLGAVINNYSVLAMGASIAGKITLSTGQTLSGVNNTLTYKQWSKSFNTGDHTSITLKLKTWYEKNIFWWWPGGKFAYTNAYLSIPNSKQVITTHWVNSCTDMDAMVSGGYCAPVGQPKCVTSGSTKMFSHVPVTAKCWSYQTNYTCGTTINTCTPLVSSGCQQIGSTCAQKTAGGICESYTNTYQCPTQKCAGQGVVCLNNAFCTAGTCYAAPKPTKTTKQDKAAFNKAVVGLAGVSNAANQFSGSHGVTTFQGQAMSCNDDVAGFSNCCRGGGWGHDIHLAHCSDEEKKLGKDREDNLAIPVGEYCSSWGLFHWWCNSHRKSYCVFSGVLAKIIQNQGRRGQLGIGFGSANSPDCSGISPATLQRINFNDIDFSAFYKQMDTNGNIPSDKSAASAAIKNIKKYFHNHFGG